MVRALALFLAVAGLGAEGWRFEAGAGLSVPFGLMPVSNRLDEWTSYVRAVDGRALAGHVLAPADDASYTSTESSNNAVRFPAWSYAPVMPSVQARVRRDLGRGWSAAFGGRAAAGLTMETGLLRAWLSNDGTPGYVGLLRGSWRDEAWCASALGDAELAFAPPSLEWAGIRPEAAVAAFAGWTWVTSRTRGLVEIYEKLQGGTPGAFLNPRAEDLVLTRSEAADTLVERAGGQFTAGARLTVGGRFLTSSNAVWRVRGGLEALYTGEAAVSESASSTVAEFPPAGVTYLDASGQIAPYASNARPAVRATRTAPARVLFAPLLEITASFLL